MGRTAAWLLRRAGTCLVMLGVAASALVVAADPGARPAVDADAAARVEPAVPALPDAPEPDPALLRVGLPLGYATVPGPPPEAVEPAGPAEPAATDAEPEPRRRTGPPAAPGPAPGGLPLPVDAGSSRQVVTVVAPSSGSTSATLTAWQLGDDGWTPALGPVSARLGSAGVGQASESSTRTPAGTFTLTEGFGRSPDPGTGLPYRVIDPLDWWVSDVASPLYNQHTRCAAGTCPFDESAGENLWAEEASYDLAVVIDYNRGGRPGAGSAFFLHVTNGAPTAGCVAIPRDALAGLMRWLDPGARPLIAIGVG